MSKNEVYITAEGLKKLEEELDHLRVVRRQEVAPAVARGHPGR